MPALLLITATAAGYLAFACLALAMPRHWSAATGRRDAAAPPRRRLRRLGFALLAGACGLCVGRDGPAFGSLLWLVLMSVTAVALALTLAWRPHWLAPMRCFSRRPQHDKT